MNEEEFKEAMKNLLMVQNNNDYNFQLLQAQIDDLKRQLTDLNDLKEMFRLPKPENKDRKLFDEVDWWLLSMVQWFNTTILQGGWTSFVMTTSQSVILIDQIAHRILVGIKQISSFIVIIGMKYAVVWMKQKKNKQTKQQAIFYNLEDAIMWEQHVNMTEHAKTELHPIWGDSWQTGLGGWQTPFFMP